MVELQTAARTVTLCRDGGSRVWFIGLGGEHDLSSIPLLERETADVLRLCSRAIIDVSDATFIDCSVLNWLIRTKRMLETSGRSIAVVEGAADTVVWRLLDLAGLRRAFELHSTRRAACAGSRHAPDAFGT